MTPIYMENRAYLGGFHFRCAQIVKPPKYARFPFFSSVEKNDHLSALDTNGPSQLARFVPYYHELRADLALLPTHPEFPMRQLAIYNELCAKFCQPAFRIDICHELRRKLCFYVPY